LAAQRFFRHGELPLVILALLERQPMHGYQILVELEELFGEAYEPSTGTIYPAITALAEERLITMHKIGRLKTYRLTEMGRKALAQRSEKLADLELRTKTRIRSNGSLESMVDRYTSQIRTLAKRLPASHDNKTVVKFEKVLSGTVELLERVTGEGGE
jgi:DNA-binding PadR family transcriptional regulator